MENSNPVIPATLNTSGNDALIPETENNDTQHRDLGDILSTSDRSKRDAILFRVSNFTPKQLAAGRRSNLVAERYAQIRADRRIIVL
jgi:hypothetical protein